MSAKGFSRGDFNPDTNEDVFIRSFRFCHVDGTTVNVETSW